MDDDDSSSDAIPTHTAKRFTNRILVLNVSETLLLENSTAHSESRKKSLIHPTTNYIYACLLLIFGTKVFFQCRDTNIPVATALRFMKSIAACKHPNAGNKRKIPISGRASSWHSSWRSRRALRVEELRSMMVKGLQLGQRTISI
jgi:hypothetical protein